MSDKTPLRVHIATPPTGEARRGLETALVPRITLTLGPEPVPPDTEVFVGGRPTREELESCPRLRFLVIPYAGLPIVTRDLVLAHFPHLTVCNLHHNAPAAAELAVALLLAAAKRIIPADAALRRGDWRIRYEGGPALILDGKTALVLGLGAVGTRVAQALHGLGMSVHAIRRNLGGAHPPHVVAHPLTALPALLPQADALVIALPLTPETEGLIGEPELNLLRPSAVLVNVARGPIVDEEALYRVLSERRIAAAGLDVWYRYPSTAEEREHTLPSRFPFHELENVALSPHRGGALGNEELEVRRMRDLTATLNAIARGEPVPHRVDVPAGY